MRGNETVRSRDMVTGMLALTLLATSTYGQSSGAAAREEALKETAEYSVKGEPIAFNVNAESRLTFRSDLKSSDADVLVSHSGIGVGMSTPLGESVRLTLGVDAEYGYYDFDDAAGLIPGETDPFDDLYSVGGLAALTFLLENPWSVTVGGVVRVAGESDTDIEDAITGGGFVAGGYRWSRGTFLNLGVAVSSRLEDDVMVVPYLQGRVQLNETLRLETNGLGLGLVHEFHPEWEIGLRGQFEFRQYRMNDDRPGWRDGVLRDERLPIGAELTWKPAEGLRLSVEGGAVVYQEFEFRDSSGDRIDDIETEPAPYIALRLEYRF